MANVWDAMKKHAAEQGSPGQYESTDVKPNVKAPATIRKVPPRGKDAAHALGEADAMSFARCAECLVPLHDRGGHLSEEYRALRTNLLTMCDHKNFSYIITSARPGEGKTVTALNLALVLSERVNQTTLLIDGDLRKRRIGSYLKASPGPGLAEVLRGEVSLTQTIRPTALPNLSLITAGKSSHKEVAALLARPELEVALADARRRFDYVIIDTPPINTVSDAGLLGREPGEALMVVRAGKTARETVEQALGLLRSAGIKPAGVVLTQRKFYIPQYIYKYA